MKQLMLTLIVSGVFSLNAFAQEGWLQQKTLLNGKALVNPEDRHILLEKTGKAAYLNESDKEISYYGTWKEKGQIIDITYITYSGTGNITIQYRVVEKTAEKLVIESTEGGRTIHLEFKPY